MSSYDSSPISLPNGGSLIEPGYDLAPSPEERDLSSKPSNVKSGGGGGFWGTVGNILGTADSVLSLVNKSKTSSVIQPVTGYTVDISGSKLGNSIGAATTAATTAVVGLDDLLSQSKTLNELASTAGSSLGESVSENFFEKYKFWLLGGVVVLFVLLFVNNKR